MTIRPAMPQRTAETRSLEPTPMIALEMNGTPLPSLHGGPARVLVPGFIDSHVHFATWGVAQAEVRLEETRTIEEALERVRAVEHLDRGSIGAGLAGDLPQQAGHREVAVRAAEDLADGRAFDGDELEVVLV